MIETAVKVFVMEATGNWVSTVASTPSKSRASSRSSVEMSSARNSSETRARPGTTLNAPGSSSIAPTVATASGNSSHTTSRTRVTKADADTKRARE